MFFNQVETFVVYSLFGFILGFDVIAAYFVITGVVNKVKGYIKKKNDEDPLKGFVSTKDVF